MNAEMLKGHLDAIVLAAFEPGPAHGYSIIEKIRLLTDGTFDLPEGTIYPALHRLEQAKLLRSKWAQAPSGRQRRVYSLTSEGRASLRQRKDDWRRFAATVDVLLGDSAPCPI